DAVRDGIDPRHRVSDCSRDPDAPVPERDAGSAAANWNAAVDAVRGGIDSNEPVSELVGHPHGTATGRHSTRREAEVDRRGDDVSYRVDSPEPAVGCVADHPDTTFTYGRAGQCLPEVRGREPAGKRDHDRGADLGILTRAL